MMHMDIPDFSEICFVGGDLTEFNARRFGSEIRRLDISYNAISRLKGLETCAPILEELILDNNQLDVVELIAPFPKLHTLSINKNKISSMQQLLFDLKTKAPSLRFLSLLGNPICPDQLSDDFVDDSDYQVYRYHVLYHLRTLKFLDHRPVSLSEAKESRKTLYGNLRISPTVTPLSPTRTTATATLSKSNLKGSSHGGSTLSVVSNSSVVSGKSRQGKKKFKYLGKNSEGNRFIKDSDL